MDGGEESRIGCLNPQQIPVSPLLAPARVGVIAPLTEAESDGQIGGGLDVREDPRHGLPIEAGVLPALEHYRAVAYRCRLTRQSDDLGWRHTVPWL